MTVYHGREKTAETTFVLYSEDWFLIKADGGKDTVVGDTLVIDKGTDLDNLVVGWADGFKLE